MLTLLLVFVLLGVVAGLMGGALGLGGGVVIVPALLLVLPLLDGPAEIIMQQAVATSLATIAFTSVSAIRGHWLRHAVRQDIVWPLAAGIVLGAFAGATFASGVPGATLARLFGLFAMVISLQMALSSRRRANDAPERLPGRAGLALSGGVIGAVSAMFGIGGGSMTVPFLSACRIHMQQAVAASAVCGLPIALGGATGFIIGGWQQPGLPAGSFGFVYLPAVAGIVLTSFPMARVGTRLAHRLPARALKRGFAVALFLIGLKLLL